MTEYVIAKYLRLSIDDAKTDSLSLENQRLITDNHIRSLDEYGRCDIKVLEFVDNGYTGTNFERPNVQALLELVRSGGVDCVIVKDFSRFGRNSIETGYFIEQVFPLFNTRFISVSDEYDSMDFKEATGGLDVAFRLMVHEQYSRDISKKVKSAILDLSQRGEYMNGNPIFGYAKDGNSGFSIDEPAAETVRMMFTLAAAGKSISEIAKYLYDEKKPTPGEYKGIQRQSNRMTEHAYSYIWHDKAIRTILADERYIGTYIAHKTRKSEVGSGKKVLNNESEWIRIPCHHPAIVDAAVFDAVQEVLRFKARSSHRGKPSLNGMPTVNNQNGMLCRDNPMKLSSSVLKGKVICGLCGHTMVFKNTKHPKYLCQYTIHALDAPCHGHCIPALDLENVVLGIINKQAQLLLGIDRLDSAGSGEYLSAQQSEYETQVATSANKAKMLYERFILGDIAVDEYREEKAVLDVETRRLNLAHKAIREEVKVFEEVMKSSEGVRDIATQAVAAANLTRSLVDLLIERVYTYPRNRIEVSWKLKSFAGAGMG